MTFLPPKLVSLSDKLLSPPPDYAVLRYKDRLKNDARAVMKGEVSKLPSLLMLGLMMGSSLILSPAALVLKTLGYRFVNIDLAQVGSMLYLDLLLREDKVKKKTPRSKILVLWPYLNTGNNYLLSLYGPHVTFIKNPLLKFLLSPFFVSFVFKDNSYRFDQNFSTETVAHKIWNDYLAQSGGLPLIAMPAQDVAECRALLKSYIPENTKFVTFHVRDAGFYKDAGRTTRNADVHTYKKAIQHLIAEGYAVIRLGDKTADDITGLMQECGPLLFDYANSPIKSPRMDCYLMSHCAFFLGLASGPSNVPMLFGVKSCNVNFYTVHNAANFLKGDIASFKKFRYVKDNSLVPFEKLLEPPYRFNPSFETLAKEGVWLENSDENEILETVREFLEQGGETELQNAAKAKLKIGHYSYGAQGNFSNTVLRHYRTDLV